MMPDHDPRAHPTAASGHMTFPGHRTQEEVGQSQQNQFAELLAQDLPMETIADRMAISRPYARTLLQRIIKRLGKG